MLPVDAPFACHHDNPSPSGAVGRGNAKKGVL
jgi:hypothetical protein